MAQLKRVVSISIGSSKRNHRVEMDILGERFVIERIGTDGDMKRAAELFRELDGQVDCFGMGGIDLSITVGDRKYRFREGVKLGKNAVKTPIVDGSGLKNTLEGRVVHYMNDTLGIPLAGKKVFLVSAADRFGMAAAFRECGTDSVYGDLMFAVGLPIPLRNLDFLNRIAKVLAPAICSLPFQLVYPTGAKQEEVEPNPRVAKYYEWADIIAGDWHYIKKHMPRRLFGKIVLTNTVTPNDVVELSRRGVYQLVTTTPNLNGRSFGTNVVEAVVIAMAGKRPEEMTADDYNYWVEQLGFAPRVEFLQRDRTA